MHCNRKIISLTGGEASGVREQSAVNTSINIQRTVAQNSGKIKENRVKGNRRHKQINKSSSTRDGSQLT